MPNIVVSAHGGRWVDEKPTLEVPAESAVAFYVADGGLLPNTEGYLILDALRRGDEPGGKVVEELGAGDLSFDYSCWFAKEFKADCGIFEVGTGKLLLDLSTYTEDAPLLLAEIFKRFPKCKVYWDCCREISPRGEAFSGQLDDSVFPGPRPS